MIKPKYDYVLRRTTWPMERLEPKTNAELFLIIPTSTDVKSRKLNHLYNINFQPQIAKEISYGRDPSA